MKIKANDSATSLGNDDFRAIARNLTKIEKKPSYAFGLILDLIKRGVKPCPILGVTGAPGVGKSSLISCLISHYRKTNNQKIAVLAVDPSSPLTGGAILGDRIRMLEHAGDCQVFIRSMGSRECTGGLAGATMDMANYLTRSGFDLVIVETVGVGQSEIDIVSIADVLLLILSPEYGDYVQTLKAGIMELADIFVINKADTGAPLKLFKDISVLLQYKENGVDFGQEIVKTVAQGTTDIGELISALEKRFDSCPKSENRFQGLKFRLQIKRMLERHGSLVKDNKLVKIKIDKLLNKIAQSCQFNPYILFDKIVKNDFPEEADHE